MVSIPTYLGSYGDNVDFFEVAFVQDRSDGFPEFYHIADVTWKIYQIDGDNVYSWVPLPLILILFLSHEWLDMRDYVLA